MKSLSVADIAIGGVVLIGGYYAYKMAFADTTPNTIEECAKAWASMPEPYRGLIFAMFDTKNRGKKLSDEIDVLTDLLRKDGFKDEADCMVKYKPQIIADIESTELVAEGT